MQVDPIGYEDQINLYAYVGNDPANGTDPSGLDDVFVTPKNVSVVVYYNNRSELTDAQLARGMKMTEGTSSDGKKFVVIPLERSRIDSVTFTTNPALNDSNPDGGRSNIYGRGGMDVQLAPQATEKTVGHETGHHFGLPDLYKGGSGEQGTLTKDAPGAKSSLMGYGKNVSPSEVDKMIGFVKESPMNNVVTCDEKMKCK